MRPKASREDDDSLPMSNDTWILKLDKADERYNTGTVDEESNLDSNDAATKKQQQKLLQRRTSA